MLRSTLPPPGLLDPSLDLTNREMQLLGQAHSASVIWAESQSVLNQSPCTPPLAIRKEIVTAWFDMEARRKTNARNRNGLDKTINEVVSVAENLGWILSSSFNPGPAKDGMKKTGALMEEFISDPWLLVFERKDESEGQKMAVLLCDQSSFIASRSGKGMRPNAEHLLKLDMIQAGTGCKTVALSLSQWAGASRAQRDGIITSLTLL